MITKKKRGAFTENFAYAIANWEIPERASIILLP